MLRTLGPDQRLLLFNALERAQYNAEGISALLGSVEAPAIRNASFARTLYLTQALRPLDVFIRLFLNSVAVPGPDVAKAIEPLTVESLETMGLVRNNGDALEPLVTLMPFEGSYVVFDIPMRMRSGAAPDHVVGASLSGMHVHNAMVRRHSRRTLDLGSGCGNLALSAAAFSDEVVGIDINARAVNFARFAAWLNGAGHVEFVEGDGFAPVQDQRFDLIVANLPFVLSPSLRYQYRDAGMRADLFAKKMVRDAPAVLAEGGFAQFLCQWAHVKGSDWQRRVVSWFEGLPCDVLVMRLEESEASAYAERWIEDTESQDASTFEEWMKYYRAEGIEAVSSGIITMCRTEKPVHWVRIEEIPRTFNPRYGEALLRRFSLIDLAEGVSRIEDLLPRTFQAAPDLRLVQTSAPGDGKWKPLTAEVRLTEGLHYDGNVDALVGNLITLFNGRRTVGQVIEALANVTRLAPEPLAQRCLLMIKDLVSRGFLLPPATSL